MLSYAHGVGDAPLLGDTIGSALARTAARFGDREALVVRSQGYRATWRALADESAIIARGLLAHGVARGDRVGIWSPNRYEWVLAQLACARAGAILVNLNPAYKTAEIEYALAQSSTSLLLHARAFRTSDYGAMVAEVRPRLPALREVIVFDDDWAALADAGRAHPADELAEREASLSVRRPDQHPVHLGHHRLPQGRHAHAPQHPQQRLLRRPRAAASPSTIACASRCRSITASAWSWATSPASRSVPP